MNNMVSDYLKRSVGACVYNKYPDISDRAHWDCLSDELKSLLIKAGEEAKKEPWTQLLISDFYEFSKTGNRVRFEDKYFPRRRKLNSLVMAECVENKGRFVDDILDGLYLILEETSWCLPPHNSYERDARQEVMPDPSRPIIDLFQAESGAEVAFCEYLLRPVFEKISPFISKNVNNELQKRIFEPYLNQHFWWMGNGDEPMCNWTPWCTQNVLICALTRPEDYFTEGERRVFLEKAAGSCDAFLKDYGEDGCCSEGAQYYTHAGLCLWGCLEIIDYASNGNSKVCAEIDEDGRMTAQDSRKTDSNSLNCEAENVNGRFGNIYSEPKVRNIANYIVKMHAAGDYYINFADCSAKPGHRTAREFLFGKATGDKVLSGFAAKDFRNEDASQKLILDEINLFYHVVQAFSYDEMGKYPDSTELPENCFFESTGLMVARNEHFVVGAKAGNNADSHNHNDVGSFTIYKDGKPFIIDLGVGTYTQKTFSDKRYEIWTMQSQFHNLPTFLEPKSYVPGDVDYENAPLAFLGMRADEDFNNPDIIMQKDGAEFAARDVHCNLEGEAHLSMDIAGAYGDERIKCYVREVSLKDGAVLVNDRYKGSLPVTLSIMTYEKPALFGSKECLWHFKVGDIGCIEVNGSITDVRIEEAPINDERLGNAWKHSAWRILLSLQGEDLKKQLKGEKLDFEFELKFY